MTNTSTTLDQGDWFSADRPILGRAEDRLGRAHFAESLANAVRRWRGRDSLVVALYGAWGSGKSSIKNIAVEAIRAESGQAVSIAEFNPWQFANRDRLTEAFFDEVGVALGRGAVGTQRDRRRLLARWQRYAARLRAGKALVDLIRKPLVVVLTLNAALLFVSAAADLRGVYIALGAIVASVAALLGWSSRFAEAIGRLAEAGVDVGRKSVEEVRGELAQELRRLERPLLVVIDDLDRLTPAETLEMFQLIKANADFPNVVYLVLFDRQAAERNIEKVLQVSGREYIEKIVQVGFDIPAVERDRLERLLFEGLDRILLDEVVAKRFDRQRWGNLFLGPLRSRFQTVRQVNRFLSTLAFHASLFRGDRSFEVNPVDLIGLEVLRTFDSEVYRALPSHKGLLTSLRDRERSGERDEGRKEAESLLSNASTETREGVRETLAQLFPPIERVLGGMGYSTDSQEVWYRELRVCSPQVFDRYFALAIPSGDIAQAAIDEFLAHAGDLAALRDQLEGLASRGLLPVFLNRLEAYKEQIPLEHAPAFVPAIFDLGERLPEERLGFMVSPAMHAARIVYWYLRREREEGRRRDILNVAVQQTTGLSLPVWVTGLEEQRAQKQGESGERLVSDEGLGELRQACVRKIEAAAAAGTLADNTELLMILYRWRDWGGEQDAKRFCAELARTPEGALKLVGRFVVHSTSHGLGDHVAREHKFIRLLDVETFIAWEELESRIAGVDEASLSDDDRVALQAFRTAVARRRQGKPDLDGFRHSEDDE